MASLKKQTRDFLWPAARKFHLVNYAEVNDHLGGPFDLTLSVGRKDIGELLGSVSIDAHRQGLPLITALVIHKKGLPIPGKGFFDLARDLGKLKTKNKRDEMLFWYQELNAVYAAAM